MPLSDVQHGARLEAVRMVMREIEQELLRAIDMHSSFNSAHEGYSVILEELDELWVEVKKAKSKRNPVDLHDEAVQVAAMAARFVMELCD